MNKNIDTKTRIELFSIWDMIVAIAKHRVGMMTDEGLKELIAGQDEMLKSEKKMLVMLALLDVADSGDGLDSILEKLKNANAEGEE